MLVVKKSWVSVDQVVKRGAELAGDQLLSASPNAFDVSTIAAFGDEGAARDHARPAKLAVESDAHETARS